MDQEKVTLIHSLLLKRVNEVELSELENKQLEDWIKAHPLNEGLANDISNPQILHDQFSEYVDKAAQYEPVRSHSRVILFKVLRYISVAAAVLLVAGIWYFKIDRKHNTDTASTSQHTTTSPIQILPGSNKAILTLADNSKVVLDGQNGPIAQQGSANVHAANGELLYDQSNTKSTPENIGYNTVTTPRGGYNYRIVLADGSIVYLNAASSLKYPPVFNNDTRMVELTGEAYFEIARKLIPGTAQKVPFLVKTGSQVIEVLGTKFDVNDYRDRDGLTISTLLEGSVAITAGDNKKLLKPGQQSLLNNYNQHIAVEPTQAEDAILWLKGAFNFADKTSLNQLLKEISRWYDVSYELDKNIPDDKLIKATISGSIERNIPLSDLLKNVENVVGNNLHFTLRGRTIYIEYKP
jgi:transmembrane sensor